MGGLGGLLFDVGASTVTLSSDLARAESMTARSAGNIVVELNKIGTGANFSGVSNQVQGLVGDLNSLKSTISGIFGVGLGVGMVKDAMGLADEYQNVSNRIRTTVSDAGQLATKQREIFEVSQQTGAVLDDTAKMYQRLEQSIQGSGKSQTESQKEAIALAKTLNEEIVVSGASAGEASRAIMDLVHGLSGGVLHAQQLRPIMRQMPDLARQIAEGMGLSAKQFEEMVHKGLPAEEVLKALAAQAGAIDERFNSLPKTFARAWTELHNAVEQYVGQASQASAVSDLIKNSIVGIANNIGTVATGAEAIAVAMAAWLGGKSMNAIAGIAISLKEMALAQGEYKTQAILSAEADLANATASRAALAATIAQADARNDLRVAEIAGLNAKSTALAREIALLDQEAISGANVLAASERLIAARAELTVVTTRVAEVEGAMAASQARATLAEQAEAAATAELTASKVALTTATAEATAASGLFARAGSGILAMVGGIPSLVVAAGAALIYLYTTESTLEEQTDKLVSTTKALNEAHGNVAANTAQASQALYEQARATEELTNARIKALQAQMEQMAASGSAGTAIAQLSNEMAGLLAQEHASEVAAGSLAGALLRVKAVAAGQWLSNLLAPDIKVSLASVDAFNGEMDKMGAKFKEQAATYHMGHAALLQYKIDQELAKESVGKSAEQIAILSKELEDGNRENLASARAFDEATAAAKNHTLAMREETKEQKAKKAAMADYQADLLKVTDAEEQLASGLGGPYLAALKTYQKGLDSTAKTWADATAAGTANATLIGRLSDLQQGYEEQLAATNAQIKAQHDVMAQSTQELAALQAIQGVAPQLQAAITEGLKEYDALMKSHYDFYGNYIQDEKDLKAALDAQLPVYTANKQAINDLSEEQKRNEQVSKDWQGIWITAGNSIADTFSKILVEGGSMMDGLKSIAKQVVESIISQFVKLQVINPILNSIFGGQSGYSMLATGGGGGGGFGGLLAAGVAAFSGGGSSGGSSASTSNVLGGLTSSAVQGSGFSLFSPSSWVTSGKNLFSGFQQGSANAGSTMFGTWSGSTGSVQQVGGMGVNMPYGGPGTYTPSALGYGAAAVGGLYAGYNEYNAVGGGLRGVGAGVGYGVGTAALSLGLGSMAAGGTFAAGIGATAGGASALGASAGVAAAVPIIGWVALIAMVVDHFTGGKIFGSGWKPKDSTSNIALGQDGATVTNTATMWRYQSQLSQSMGNFGGLLSPSDWGKKDWKTQNIAITPEQQKAADDFYNSIKKIMTDDAKSLAIDTPPMIEASLRTVNTYTKKGKIDTTKIFVDMLGQSWEEATTALAAQRISVEAQIATIGASSKGQGASDIAQQWRANLDQLTDGAGAMMGMTLDLTSGFKLLGMASTATLADVVKFTQGFEASGESLTAAYQRLEQANVAYQQFVAQFKPSTTYVDQFEASLSQLNGQMNSNIKQANDLAKAAGAEGASVEDLANIHAAAAQQFVTMVLQLQASAQSLAFALGLTNTGTLDQVSAEIQRLQGIAGNSSQPINDFGSAMQNSAQAASDAINLLLGDLSPLNDQQKLATALQGLYAGTVTQTQVLEIGRRLYATGQQYTDLFNTVMAHPGASTGSGASGGGASMGGTAATGLTAAESQRLTDLLKEQQQLQASQTLSQYKTLAQQIAEIASATGETYQQVIDEMGIKNADLEKGLKLANDDALKAYIADLQKQQDGNKENTTSIVAALNRIYDAIVHAGDLPGTPGGHSTRPSGGDVPNSAIVAAIDRNTGSQQQYIDHTLRLATTGNASQNRGLRTPDLV